MYKKIIFLLLITALFSGCAKQIINQNNTATNHTEKNIYSIEELRNSGLPEGSSANVKLEGDACQKINFKVSKDYEGAGSGTYYNGLEISNYKDNTQIENICSLASRNGQVIIKGEIRYCGGKKITRYICGLRNVELLDITQNDNCSADSDCRYTCGCGCINVNSECNKEALCNTPPGSCRCKNNKCSFSEDNWQTNKK